MATTLIQQSIRADDERFRSQIRAALMRDQPDMLRAPGLLADDATAGAASGPYIVGATLALKRENAGKARAFGQRITAQREQVVQHVAQLVAGANPVLAIDIPQVAPAAPASLYELALATDTQTTTLILGQVRVAVKALAEIE